MPEVWKMFRHGYYEVSNLGRVRRIKSVKYNPYVGILKTHVQKDGYVQVTTSVKGRIKVHLVHVLVARKFIGHCPPGKEVNHKDRDRSNNCWDNLEYLTCSDNHKYSVLQGSHLGAAGEDHARAKLGWKETNELRKLWKSGKCNQGELAKIYNVSQSCISRIVNHQRWSVTRRNSEAPGGGRCQMTL